MKKILLFISFMICFPLFGQITITGRVTDENGMPFPNVKVSSDSQSQTLTDKNGFYKLVVGQWDVVFFEEGHHCYPVVEKIPKQEVNVKLSHREKDIIVCLTPPKCRILFILDGKPVKADDVQNFKQALRKGEFKYTVVKEEALSIFCESNAAIAVAQTKKNIKKKQIKKRK